MCVYIHIYKSLCASVYVKNSFSMQEEKVLEKIGDKKGREKKIQTWTN